MTEDPPKKKPRWRRALRIVRRFFYVLFAILAVAIIVGLIIIHTTWGRNEIREMVEAELRSAFPGGAKIGALEGSVISDFTLRDIEIDSLDGKPAIKIGRVTTNIALLKLFNKTAELEYLELEDVSVAVGGAALRKPSEPTEPGEPTAWSVSLQQISLTKGNFAVLGEQPQHIDDLDLTGGVEIPAGRRITAHVLATARWRERGAPILIDAATAVGDTTMIRRGTINVGKVQVVATRVALDPTRPTGKIEITGTADAIAELLPQVKLPADAKLTLEAKPAGAVLQVAVDGTVGDARLTGSLRGDIASQTISGYVGIGALEIGGFLPPSLELPEHVRGEVALALTANRAGAHGILGVHGAALDLPSSDATILVDTTWKAASVTLLAAGEGNAKVAATAHGTRKADKTIAIDRGRVVATAASFAAPTADRVPVAGDIVIDAALTKPGTLAPKLDLDFNGTARGARVSYDVIRVASLATTFRGTANDKLTGHAHADVRGAVRAGKPLGYATVEADLLEDGRIWTHLDAHPAMAAVGVVANGWVEPGKITRITLRDHVITPSVGAPWVGKGGVITLADSISVKDFVTTNGNGKAKVDAQLAGDNLSATVDATAIPVSAIDPALKGEISGKLGIKRRAGRWDGGGDVVATGLVFDPKQPSPFDGTAKLRLDGRRVELDAHATSKDIGAVRAELDVEGPRDITDVDAWRRLERSAMKNVTITIDKVELAKVSPTGGFVDGKLVLGAATAEGSVDIKGIETPVGVAEGTVTFSPQGSQVYASWDALLSEVGEGNIGVRVELPQHPFDPASWKQLGRAVVQGVTATFDNLTLDPTKLEKLGVKGVPYTALADIKLDVATGATAATLGVDLRNIEGGVLAQPIDLHLQATVDGNGTIASACAARTKDPKGDACAKRGLATTTTAAKLFEIVDARAPVPLATWVNNPKSALAAPLTGKVTVPSQSAPQFFALFGRQDFDPNKGTLKGTVTIAGALGKPTGEATFELEKLQLVTDLVAYGRSIPELTTAKLTASWDGSGGWIDLDTQESNRGTLHAKVIGKPAAWQEATGSLEAAGLDLAPLAAFLPGELRSSQGLLTAKVAVASLDLATARLDGHLEVERAQMPIHPIAGTLRDATLRVLMTDKGVELHARGLLNACRDPEHPRCGENVWLDATSPSDLSRIDGTLYANKISTIGEIEPIIDGMVKINLRRSGGQLVGDIAMRNCRRGDDPKRCRDGHIVVPVSTGDDLLDFDAPDDLFFIENAPKQTRFGEARVPTRAWLDVQVSMESTRIDVLEYGVKGSIVTRQPMRLQVGDAVGLDGKISVEYGSADDIFGRQYEIEPNDLVSFDGTIDPSIDLRMSHQFSELLLTVKVQGRLSDLDFPHATFEADRGAHSESELFGYFLGGEPGSGSTNQAGDAALGAGYSVASQFLSKQLKNVLPGKLKLVPDVIKCEPGASIGGSGGSCTVGYRLLHDKMYVTLKHHLIQLPNENTEELNLQYNLSHEWFVEGAGGTSNIIGADLLWRRRW